MAGLPFLSVGKLMMSDLGSAAAAAAVAGGAATGAVGAAAATAAVAGYPQLISSANMGGRLLWGPIGDAAGCGRTLCLVGIALPACLLAGTPRPPTLKLRPRGCGRRYLTPVAAQQACRSRRAHSRAAPTPRPPSLSSVPRRASMSALTRACRCFSRRRPPRCTAPGLCAVYAECWNGAVGDCGPVWLSRRCGHLPAHRRDHHFRLAPRRRRVHALARWRLCAARSGADRAV